MFCRMCKQEKEPSSQRGLCNDCSREYQREYRARNKERLAEYWRNKNLSDRQNPEFVKKERKRGIAYWNNLRHEAIMAYGGYKCACCGETEPMFLSLDHINNDGAAHRRSLGYEGNGKGASSKTLSWMKHNNYPDGFQVLCMNCNFGKARNKGICPHHTIQK